MDCLHRLTAQRGGGRGGFREKTERERERERGRQRSRERERDGDDDDDDETYRASFYSDTPRRRPVAL